MIKVNLLPPDLKAEIDQAKKNKKILTAFYKTFLVLGGVMLITVANYYILNLSLNAATSSLREQEESVKAYGNLEEKSKKIAERITTIKRIDAGTNKWSGVSEEIQKIIPEGVSLISIKLDSNLKVRSTMAGEARSKKEVAALREVMEKSDKFEYVDIENSVTTIDPATKAEIENFSLTFSLEKEALE